MSKPRYPKLVVDLSKCEDTIDIEGKVHGQMKEHLFPSKGVRKEFTAAIRQARTYAEAVEITKQWVTVVEPKLGWQQQGKGECFSVHAQALTRAALLKEPIAPGATGEVLCHGDVFGEAVGWHKHCWLEFKLEFPAGGWYGKGGAIWMVKDLTVELVIPQDLYYRWGKVRNVKRYTEEQVAILMLKTGHFGPWE